MWKCIQFTYSKWVSIIPLSLLSYWVVIDLFKIGYSSVDEVEKKKKAIQRVNAHFANLSHTFNQHATTRTYWRKAYQTKNLSNKRIKWRFIGLRNVHNIEFIIIFFPFILNEKISRYYFNQIDIQTHWRNSMSAQWPNAQNNGNLKKRISKNYMYSKVIKSDLSLSTWFWC